MKTLTAAANTLHRIQRITKLDLQSASMPLDKINLLKDIANPVTTQFHAISSAIATVLQIRPTFFLSSRNEGAKLKDLNYLTVTGLQIQVPEGMSCLMTKYTSVLLDATVTASDLVKVSLDPFQSFLEDVITNKASLSSVTSYSGVMKTLGVARVRLNNEFGKCFKDQSFETVASFGNVFTNKTDYLRAIDDVEKLNNWLGKVSIKAIEAKVKRICQLLDTLVEQVNNEVYTDVSKSNLTYLAECAYDIGREVEFFAILIYRIQTVSASMNVASEKVCKVSGK